MAGPRRRSGVRQPRAQSSRGQKKIVGRSVNSKASFDGGVYSKTYKKAPTNLSPTTLFLYLQNYFKIPKP